MCIRDSSLPPHLELLGNTSGGDRLLGWLPDQQRCSPLSLASAGCLHLRTVDSNGDPNRT
eukprot:8393768-Alexandrium_andersonii.AAC.1